MKRTIRDPHYGDIEFPDPPTREEFERSMTEARAGAGKTRLWPVGVTHKCPACGKKSLIGRDDLVHRIAQPGRILVFRHLGGARCDACRAQYLEPADLIDIEDEASFGLASDHEASVSRVGSGTIATYWPKDVVRNMALAPGTKAYIQILDRDTALLRFRERPGEPTPLARRTRSSAPKRRRRASKRPA